MARAVLLPTASRAGQTTVLIACPPNLSDGSMTPRQTQARCVGGWSSEFRSLGEYRVYGLPLHTPFRIAVAWSIAREGRRGTAMRVEHARLPVPWSVGPRLLSRHQKLDDRRSDAVDPTPRIFGLCIPSCAHIRKRFARACGRARKVHGGGAAWRVLSSYVLAQETR